MMTLASAEIRVLMLVESDKRAKELDPDIVNPSE
jgi:hypothetical protein